MATEIGVKILRRLAELDMTQARLARLIGETPVRVHKWLNGVGAPRPDDLVAISRALELPLEYLADSSIDDPSGLIYLDEDGRAVLTLFHALGLDRDEALRRLARPAEAARPQPARPLAGPPHEFPPSGLKAGPGAARTPPAREPRRKKG